MMHEGRPAVRTAERIAGVIAVVAALVVLNGAWENQHTWQNLSWRVAMSAALLGLTVIVETNAVGILQARLRRTNDTAVPDFLRTGTMVEDGASDNSVRAEEGVEPSERARMTGLLQESRRDAD
jgi:hypothetical protein